MAKKPFFIFGDRPSAVTRTQFRRMRREEKHTFMLEWFRANYEDPAERTPYESREGGYQWIWGGPYDAEEEIRGQFEGLVPEKIILEIVAEVESDGLLEWAPTPRAGDYDENEAEDEDEDDTDPLDLIGDEPGLFFNSSQERLARREALEAIRNFQKVLDARPAGLGHNNPPAELLDSPPKEITAAVEELGAELEAQQPRIPVAKKLIRGIGSIFGKSAKWIGRKVDVVVDEALKNIARLAVFSPILSMEPNIQLSIIKIYQTAMKWIDLATSYF
ncbi:MAG: hypothetical protein NTY94_18515 [Alphaproteobacteria bacterium]|nr:hypothetical protein [Alphaproteobacteria bacterium]